MDYIRAAIQFLWLFICNLVLDILGLFVVAIAIPFRVDGVSLSDGRPIKNLPKLVWLFGNDYDGLLGDKRLWWAENTPFGLPVETFIPMYTWAALRNPVNNMRLTDMFSCPLDGSTVTFKGQEHVRDHAGEGGWQFVTTENNGKKWYGFYFVHEWSETRAFVVRLGFKTEPKDAGTTDRQGMTTKINPFKSI